MPIYSDYQTILNSVNFIGGAGQTELIEYSGDDRTVVNQSGGVWQFYYHSLTSAADFTAHNYHDTWERTNTPGGSPALTTSQTQVLQNVLHASLTDHYSVTFEDVALIQFNAGGSTNAHITIGQVENLSPSSPAYSYDQSNGDDSLNHGDVWLNADASIDWTQTSEGTYTYQTIQHEIGHSLGLKGDNHLLGTSINSQQYTIMSYNQLAGMNVSGSDNDVTPFGLQLIDIAAIQEIYGINWNTRDENNTQYSATTAFSSSRPHDAFIYTIWDGGGTGDTIDASDYNIGAAIDLREGHFSSVGYNASGGAAANNLAIAYKAEIENAIGTDEDDIITGNDLNNVLKGEDGDDVFYGSKGSDEIRGGTDNDQLYYSIAPIFLKVTVVDATNNDYEVEKWYVGSDPTTDPADDTDTLYSIESGFDKHQEINYTFTQGSYGGTALNGDEFDNNLADPYATSALTIAGMAGNDSLQGNNTNDLLDGGEGNDIINSGHGNNKLLGGAGNDSMVAGNGDDYLDGGAGDDILNGGTGNDYFFYTAGNDTITGGGGADVDTVELSGVSFSDITFSRAVGSTDIVLDISGGDIVTLSNQNNGYGIDILKLSDGTYQMKDIQVSVVGTVAGDTITGSYSYLSGGTHYYHAASIDDLAYGHGGHDHINLSHGNNIAYGGDGNDTIIGGNDSDLFYGDAGNDSISGNNGNDFLYGGAGNDSVNGGYGSDALFGDAGTDTLTGGNGADHLEGGADTDTLYGGAGNDVLYGDAGNDNLYGDGGDDFLDGGAGNDFIRGSSGNDTYFYSSGSDTFSEQYGSGADIIEFDSGIDLTDLTFSQSGWDLDINVAGAGDITIQFHYYSSALHIETLKFADGSTTLLSDVI